MEQILDTLVTLSVIGVLYCVIKPTAPKLLALAEFIVKGLWVEIKRRGPAAVFNFSSILILLVATIILSLLSETRLLLAAHWALRPETTASSLPTAVCITFCVATIGSPAALMLLVREKEDIVRIRQDAARLRHPAGDQANGQ